MLLVTSYGIPLLLETAFVLNVVSEVHFCLVHAALIHLFLPHLGSLYKFILSILLWMDIWLSRFLLLQTLHFSFAHESSLGNIIRSEVAIV